VCSVVYCALHSFVDFGAIYIVCLFTSPLILFFFLTFPCISFSYRTDPLRFHAGGRKRRPNLGFLNRFSLFFVLLMHAYLCSVSLGLLYIFVVISSDFIYFCFLSNSQKIRWEEHIRTDLYCVK